MKSLLKTIIICLLFSISLYLIILYINTSYTKSLSDEHLNFFIEEYIYEKYSFENFKYIHIYLTDKKQHTISGNKASDKTIFVHLEPLKHPNNSYDFCIFEVNFDDLNNISYSRQKDWDIELKVVDEGIYRAKKETIINTKTSLEVKNISFYTLLDKGDAISALSIDSNIDKIKIAYNYCQASAKLLFNTKEKEYAIIKEKNVEYFSNSINYGLVRDLGVFATKSLNYNDRILIKMGLDKYDKAIYKDQQMNIAVTYSVTNNGVVYDFNYETSLSYNSIKD